MPLFGFLQHSVRRFAIFGETLYLSIFLVLLTRIQAKLIDKIAIKPAVLCEGGDMHISDYSRYFQVHQDCAFATVYENLPYVRPMALLFVDGEFYITTGASRNKVKHLLANKHFSLYLLKKIDDMDLFIQGSGTAEIVTDAATKSRVFQAEKMIACYWPSPEHPEFTLFRLTFTELYTSE